MLKFSKTNVCNCTLFSIYRLLCIIQQNYRLLESELNHSLGTYMTLGYYSFKKVRISEAVFAAKVIITYFIKGKSPKGLGNLIQKRRHEFFTLLIWVNVPLCSFMEMFQVPLRYLGTKYSFFVIIFP